MSSSHEIMNNGSAWSVKSVLLALLLLGVAVWAGYYVGKLQSVQIAEDEAMRSTLQAITTERQELDELRNSMEAEMDALALRIGSLRAHLLRLNALGERLVDVGKLDAQEFDFTTEPAQGGLDESAAESVDMPELENELQRLSRAFADREHKLNLLEELLSRRDVREQVIPSGRPLKQGFISSTFGRRTDPFTGKKKYHKGIDFVGKRGSEVLAVAAGVVTKAERESGYGNMVEIRHADGYITRYAHNQENLVTAGDRVEKGEPIAMLGSTGRSSGPHVHFEVRRNGKIINPARFIKGG